MDNINRDVAAQEVIDALCDPVLTLDNRGIINTCNPATADVFGWTPAELIGHPVNLLLDLPLPPGQDTFLRAILGEQISSPARGELTGVRKDGSRLPVEIAVAPLDAADRQTSPLRVMLIRNVEASKRIEMKLRTAKQRAEMAGRSKSEFLANMSHEIRTHLNGILGTLGLLLETSLSQQQLSFTENAYESGKALLTIVNDILDLSKIEAGHLKLEPSEFDLVQLVESTAELVASRAHSKGIEVATFVALDVPRWLYTDADRLRQIVLNLMSNAIKFTHTGGVSVSVTRTEQNASEQIGLRFTVTDTGVGIPAAVQAKLFERFGYSRAGEDEGTGLGLAISRRLVELMQGEIGFSSQENKGTTFWFTFACRQAAARQPQPILPALKGIRVLVVEDNPITRDILSKQLAAWSMQVSSVTNGSAALKVLHQAQHQGSPFATVLIDQCLPDVSGEKLGLTISQLPALAATHPVLMTIMDASSISARVRKVGFYASLTKPLRQSSLYRWLCVALGLASESGTGLVRKRQVSEEAAKPRQGRLLLVEDNHVNQLVIMTMLKKAGYQVDVVKNGREAVKAVHAFPYDLVLMDLFMPVLDGFEATAQIRRLPSSKAHIPIVAMTASALPKHQERCREVGMNDFLTKPVDRSRLVAVVEACLSGAEISVDASEQTGEENMGEIVDENLDVHTLDQLKLDTDATLLSQLVTVFIEQTRERLDEIARACDQRDWKRLQGEAHALKSTAGTFGAKRLQNHSRRLEQACEKGELATALMLAQAIAKVATPALEALAHQGKG